MATSPLVFELPSELIIMVIHELHCSTDQISRQTSLESCSLVCKQWHAFAHPLVFHSITLLSPTGLNKFLTLLETHTSIRSAVKELTIIIPHSIFPLSYRTPRYEARCRASPQDSFGEEARQNQITYSSTLNRVLYTTLPLHLPALERLSLSGYSEPGTCLKDLSLLRNLSQFTDLRSVSFESCHIPPIFFEVFARFLPNLREYSNVENRHLYSYIFEDGESDALSNELETLSRTRPELTSFKCYAGPSIRNDISLKWLVGSPSIRSLRSLSIMFEVDAPAPFGDLLIAVAPHLEHLSLEVEGTPFSHWIGSPSYKETINLTSFTSLKTFTIRANVDPCTLLYHFLPQLSSPHITLVVIILTNIRWVQEYFARENAPIRSLAEIFDHAPALTRGTISSRGIEEEGGEDGEGEGGGGEEIGRQQTRIVFAYDPLFSFEDEEQIADNPFLPELEEEREGEGEAQDRGAEPEPEEVQGPRVKRLQSYIDGLFEERAKKNPTSPLVEYEVMSWEEARELCVAKPIDL